MAKASTVPGDMYESIQESRGQGYQERTAQNPYRRSKFPICHLVTNGVNMCWTEDQCQAHKTLY